MTKHSPYTLLSSMKRSAVMAASFFRVIESLCFWSSFAQIGCRWAGLSGGAVFRTVLSALFFSRSVLSALSCPHFPVNTAIAVHGSQHQRGSIMRGV